MERINDKTTVDRLFNGLLGEHMSKFNVIALLMILSVSCLSSSAQFDSKDWDKQKELTEVRNR